VPSVLAFVVISTRRVHFVFKGKVEQYSYAVVVCLFAANFSVVIDSAGMENALMPAPGFVLDDTKNDAYQPPEWGR